jgi:hypothetical protein
VATRGTPPPIEPPPPPDPDQPAEADLVAPSADEQPARRLRIFARRARGGQVRILVRAPAAGSLLAEVRGRLPGRSGRQTGAPSLFAGSERTLRRRGDTTLTLKIAKRHLPALRRARRLRAQATVELEARNGAVYEGRVGVVFTAPKKAKKAKKPRRPARRRSS